MAAAAKKTAAKKAPAKKVVAPKPAESKAVESKPAESKAVEVSPTDPGGEAVEVAPATVSFHGKDYEVTPEGGHRMIRS